jgi:NitT/TauT family transport system substrate-binding protein
MTEVKSRIVQALAAALAIAVVAAGCGSDTGGGGESKTKGGLTQVTMGTVNGSSSDAAMFVGMDKGFFREQGIEIKLQPFNTGAQFVAPLGAGRLDAASGGISAGLFNAVGSGVNIKLVADKSRIGKPSYTSLVVRKQLVDSGEYKDFGDLKGRKVAIPSVGVPPHH